MLDPRVLQQSALSLQAKAWQEDSVPYRLPEVVVLEEVQAYSRKRQVFVEVQQQALGL